MEDISITINSQDKLDNILSEIESYENKDLTDEELKKLTNICSKIKQIKNKFIQKKKDKDFQYSMEILSSVLTI